MSIRKVQILGVDVHKACLNELTLQAHNAIAKHSPQISFACANPHSLMTAQTDTEFLKSLNASDQVVVDGVGLSLLSKYAGIELGQRITGNDYYISILDYLKLRGQGKVFFFGSSDYVLQRIVKKFEKEYPMLECEVYSPPYGEWSEEENEKMIELINKANPDVLWVGMTAPKQEKWVEANRDKLNVSLIGSIGAVFDFYAGTYSRAPDLMCKLGIEWLYRLMKEPKRMWKRNFVSTPYFIFKFFMQHVLINGQEYKVYTADFPNSVVSPEANEASVKRSSQFSGT